MKVFALRGRILDATGQPWPHMTVAVVDSDPINDDLIGVVTSGPDGVFQIAFTDAAFNQDLFEHERRPDVYLVFSLIIGGKRRAVHRADFVTRRFEGDEDLGDITLPCKRAAPEPIDGQDPLPRFDKRQRKVKIDRGQLHHVAQEVAPLVEELTGVSGLLQKVTLRATRGLGPAMFRLAERADALAASAERAGVEPRLLELAVSEFLTARAKLVGVIAVYDPFAFEIVVDATRGDVLGLDGLAMEVGHELIHAAQFLAHPNLAAEYAAIDHELADAAQVADSSPLRAEAAAEAAVRFIANLEGYASQLEIDHLRAKYGAKLALPHASLLDVTVWRGTEIFTRLKAAGGAAAPSVFSAIGDKVTVPQRAYQAAYRSRAANGRPAPFDPTLRAE